MPSHARAATSLTRDHVSRAFGSMPFTNADAYAVGITRGQLRAALAQGYVRSLSRGIFALRGDVSDVSPVENAQSALKVLDGVPAAIAGGIAGQLHGLPFITPRNAGFQRSETEVLVARSSLSHFGRRLPRVIVRPVEELPGDIVMVNGIPTTSLLHTAVDLVRMGLRPQGSARARSLPLPEALVVLDAVARRLGDIDTGEAQARLTAIRPRFRQAQGIRAFDAAVPFVDPRAESPLESWSRGYMVVFGVPIPLLQQVLVGADGNSYRVDFCWPDAKLIGEADGIAKYGDDPRAFRRAKAEEITRQRALEGKGWRLARWTWDDLALRPAHVMGELNRAIASHQSAA